MVPAAKYLGFFLGPSADVAMQWESPLKGWRSGVAAVADTTVCPAAGTMQYNMRCVPKLAYIGQLVGPPKGLTGMETDRCNKILRLPGRTFGMEAIMHLEQFGLIRFRSAGVAIRTSLFGAASSGRLRWRDLIELLDQAGWEDELSFKRWHQGYRWGAHWVDVPFAWHLRAAAEGRVCKGVATKVDTGLVAAMRCTDRRQRSEAIRVAMFPLTCIRWLDRKLRKNLTGSNFSGEEFSRGLRRLGPQGSLDALRVVCNGLPTSSRIHSVAGVAPCIFCFAPESDSLPRLLCCRFFRHAFCLGSDGRVTKEQFMQGLSPAACAAACRVYLAVRRARSNGASTSVPALCSAAWRSIARGAREGPCGNPQ